MTERLADISDRIEGIRQLGAVVNAMKGIAAARARVARTQLGAVDSYAATISAAMSSATSVDAILLEDETENDPGKMGLLIFCAEQGFAGAFSERVLDSMGDSAGPGNLFLIGTRGLSIAAARGVEPIWTAPMPSHTPGIPKLADAVTNAIYRKAKGGALNRLDVLFTGWHSGRPAIVRQALFPIDLTNFPSADIEKPLMQLPLDTLTDALTGDYFHALVCKAALHAFAAENEARMEAMTAAGSQIARELETFEATLRRVRQEAITAEIIELGTGAKSARDARR